MDYKKRNLRQKIEQLKSMIIAGNIQHDNNKKEIEELKQVNIELDNDWETTKMCQESSQKEIYELNEYQSQLQQKLSHLQLELDQEQQSNVLYTVNQEIAIQTDDSYESNT